MVILPTELGFDPKVVNFPIKPGISLTKTGSPADPNKAFTLLHKPPISKTSLPPVDGTTAFYFGNDACRQYRTRWLVDPITINPRREAVSCPISVWGPVFDSPRTTP